jgi:hypothetical protein
MKEDKIPGRINEKKTEEDKMKCYETGARSGISQ